MNHWIKFNIIWGPEKDHFGGFLFVCLLLMFFTWMKCIW